MQNGYDLNLYSRRILLLPTMYNCGWAGLGSVGCGGSCYVFMNVRMGIPRSRRQPWRLGKWQRNSVPEISSGFAV